MLKCLAEKTLAAIGACGACSIPHNGGLLEIALTEEEKQNWTVDLHNRHLQYIRDNNVKQAKEMKGIMSVHIWDFIKPKHYIFPQLHFEIGVVNTVLDNFYKFIEDQLEVLSVEGKVDKSQTLHQL